MPTTWSWKNGSLLSFSLMTREKFTSWEPDSNNWGENVSIRISFVYTLFFSNYILWPIPTFVQTARADKRKRLESGKTRAIKAPTAAGREGGGAAREKENKIFIFFLRSLSHKNVACRALASSNHLHMRTYVLLLAYLIPDPPVINFIPISPPRGWTSVLRASMT